MRHRAAYAFAISSARRTGASRVLDLGCEPATEPQISRRRSAGVIAIDRISPDREARHPHAHFVRADAAAIPLRSACFDLVVSFQVVEHLLDPAPYLNTIGELLSPGGSALITTPNILQSDRENPFHVKEYTAEELSGLLLTHFEEVEMLGVSASPEPKAYYDARLERIRKIVRLDPLRLRRILPRRVVEALFAAFAIVVRRGIQQSEGLPGVTLDDFPSVPPMERASTCLAVCRRPRGKGAPA